MDPRRLVLGAACEIRAAEDGEQLHATLITEGRAASGGRKELFVPGSVEWPQSGIGILIEHRAPPEIRAQPTRQPDGRITIESTATPAIREAVRTGKTWMSVEFVSLSERTTKGGVREILRALVPDAAMVSNPEYDTTSVELRHAGRRRVWL